MIFLFMLPVSYARLFPFTVNLPSKFKNRTFFQEERKKELQKKQTLPKHSLAYFRTILPFCQTTLLLYCQTILLLFCQRTSIQFYKMALFIKILIEYCQKTFFKYCQRILSLQGFCTIYKETNTNLPIHSSPFLPKTIITILPTILLHSC